MGSEHWRHKVGPEQQRKVFEPPPEQPKLLRDLPPHPPMRRMVFGIKLGNFSFEVWREPR